jgi:hypothetical protein
MKALRLALAMSVVLFWNATQRSIAQELRAGAATSNITPWLGLSINGSMSNIIATHVHDELYVRCLVLDDGKTRIAFAVCDSCAVPRDLVDLAKELIRAELQIAPDHVLISATHSHSAGCMTEAFQSDADADYKAFVARRIADGVRRAVNNLEPARLGWGVADEPDLVFNRRWKMKPGAIARGPLGTDDHVKMNPVPGSADLVEPAGPTDPGVTAIWAVSPAGRKIGLLANYGLHYVGGVPAGHVSADYFGVFANRIRALLDSDSLDPPFVGMLTNGASGDVNNISFRRPDPAIPPYEKMKVVAEEVALDVAEVFALNVPRDDIRLAAAAADISLGVRKPSAEELAQAEARLKQAGGPGTALSTMEDIYARETVMVDKYPATVPVTVQALRVGDVGIVAIPCEVFAEIGLEIKAKSPFRPTFVIELANGYNGYLPTRAQHALGGYETWRARSSYLEVGASEKVVAQALELLQSLR